MRRFHSLDSARAGAMVLGVFLHATLAYTRGPIPDVVWAVHDRAPSARFDVLFWWIDSIHMPLFFLLSGFFAAMQYEGHGPNGFLRRRVNRLLVPFLVGGVIILPVTFYVWSAGWLLEGRCTLTEILRVKFGPEIQENLYGPAHLWFLEYLFIMCVTYWGATRCLKRSRLARAAYGRLIARGGRLLGHVWTPLVLAVPSALIVWINPGAIASFHNSFVPAPFRFLYYAVFFAAGAWFWRIRDAMEWCVGFAGTYLAVSLPVFICAYGLLHRYLAADRSGTVRMALAFSVACFTWYAVLGFLSLATRWNARERPSVRYLSDASYWVYLSHFPIVGLVQVVLAPVHAPAELKYVLVVSVALVVCLWSYEHFVRYSFVGAWLNGRRRRPIASALRGIPTPASSAG